MATINLLYKTQYQITDDIKVVIPTVREVIENEDAYYTLISLLTATPMDLMVQLDEMGIDFDSINEWELFCILFPALRQYDTSLIFGDLQLSNFELGIQEGTEDMVLIDRQNDIRITRGILAHIAAAIRKIHHLEKNMKKPGNKEAKEYLLERAKIKAKRQQRKTISQLETLIVAVVNTNQFKYNFETVKDLTIYQFNESVRQIIKKVDYDNRMFGVYSGSISVKDLSKDDLTWIGT